MLRKGFFFSLLFLKVHIKKERRNKMKINVFKMQILMGERGLTIKKLAELSGVSRQTLFCLSIEISSFLPYFTIRTVITEFIGIAHLHCHSKFQNSLLYSDTNVMRHPSMKVDKGFCCFACGAKGDVITFVADFFHLAPLSILFTSFPLSNKNSILSCNSPNTSKSR